MSRLNICQVNDDVYCPGCNRSWKILWNCNCNIQSVADYGWRERGSGLIAHGQTKERREAAGIKWTPGTIQRGKVELLTNRKRDRSKFGYGGSHSRRVQCAEGAAPPKENKARTVVSVADEEAPQSWLGGGGKLGWKRCGWGKPPFSSSRPRLDKAPLG